MESEQHHSPDHDQGELHWMSMAGYSSNGGQTASPVIPPYNQYNYSSASVTPIEPAPVYGVPRPPPYSSQHQLQPQPLHPLIVPQWPSMLTSQSSYSTPTLQTASTTTPSSAISASPQSLVRQTTTGGNTPRRTLTDDDRRRMCQFAEDNPGIKQNDIGLKFGVERSTVSKVLRQKEKFLFPHDGSQSPVKKSKGKFPDIERALANWAKNESRKYVLTDSMIREKARFFATTVGSNESQSKLNSSVWLEKFKQKNNLVGGRLRKSPIDPRQILHEDGITIVDSSTTSASHNSAELSPLSADDSSPTSSDSSRGTAKHELSEAVFDIPSHGYHQYHHHHNQHPQTNGSLSAGYAGLAGSLPLLSSPASPQLTHAHATSLYSTEFDNRLPPLSSNFSRPRSQTVPNLNFEPATSLKADTSNEITPKLPDPSVMMHMLDHPPEEKSSLSSPFDGPKRNNSLPTISPNKDMSVQSSHLPKSETGSPAISPIVSPTHQEARRALELVMAFFQSQPVGSVEPNEYMTMGKLMQKLELTHSPDGIALPGGLHRIDEEEGQRVTKKRSIHSL